MLLIATLLIIGVILLAYGADRLIFAAAILCRSLGISPLVIGITVVGVGASLPEMLVAFSAASRGQLNIVAGIALGSNITNILLILGCAALLHPLTVHSELIQRQIPLMLLIILLCGVLLSDGALNRFDGVVLVASAIFYLIFIIRTARHSEHHHSDPLINEQLKELPRHDISNTVALLWLVVALISLPIANRIIIDNATLIANTLGISDFLTGLTLISVGTRLPILATVIAGALKNEDDIAIGNVIGSNIYNVTLVLAMPALINPRGIDDKTFLGNYWLMLGVNLFFALLCLFARRRIGRKVGLLLLCSFIDWIITLSLLSQSQI